MMNKEYTVDNFNWKGEPIKYLRYMKHKDKLPKDMLALTEQGEPLERIVCDYISAMTDRFAIAKFEEIYMPIAWHG